MKSCSTSEFRLGKRCPTGLDHRPHDQKTNQAAFRSQQQATNDIEPVVFLALSKPPESLATNAFSGRQTSAPLRNPLQCWCEGNRRGLSRTGWRLDRVVAIKVLAAHLSDRPELRERFEREERTIASPNHPHICTLYDVGHQDGIDYLVME